MTQPIRLYNLGPSPNSTKIRLALGYKGIPHEVIDVNPADREEIVRISGQPLTPVLTHGDTVIFDSSAILRYLEANVKREPRLFAADRDQMKAIEGWEAWSRAQLGPSIGSIFGQYFSPTKDPAVIAQANSGINEAAKHLESKLGSGGYLCGDAPTAADLTCAAGFGLALQSPEAASKHPVLQFFHESLRIDPERRDLRRWFQAIDRHDRPVAP